MVYCVCARACLCGGGGVGGWGLYSGGSSIDGDSILIAQQPKALDGVERQKAAVAAVTSRVLFAALEEAAL